MSAPAVFDQPEALERCRGKADFLDELIVIYLSDAAGQGLRLEAAAAALDRETMERAAHRLKGSAVNVSLKKVAAAASALEKAAREEDPAGAAALWPDLRAALAEAEATLRAYVSR